MQADIDAVKAILDAHPEADQMTDAELDELKAAKEKLMNSAQQVFQKMYEQAQGSAQSSAALQAHRAQVPRQAAISSRQAPTTM